MSQNIPVLFKLIQSNSYLKYVQDFLKLRGAHYSAGSWSDLFTLRLQPALSSGLISIDDLHGLLREVEEHGGQHVFLYKVSAGTAAEYCTQEYLTNVLTDLGMPELLGAPKILEMPDTPTVVDARIEKHKLTGEDCLVIKVAETRTRYKQEGSEELADGRFVKTYVTIKERFSNIARLCSNGVLELRLASRSTSDQYEKELIDFIKIVNRFLPMDSFFEISLSHAKKTLNDKNRDFSSFIRLFQSRFRNGQGNSIMASTGDPTKHLPDDAGINSSIFSFASADAAVVCEHSNFWMTTRDSDPVPSRDIHVVISGKSNEFAIGGKCLWQDYEYVLSRIWEFNQPVSQ